MKLLEEFDRVKQNLKDDRLHEAYQAAATFIDAQIDGPRLAKLNTDVLMVMSTLIKTLSLSGNIRMSDDILSRCLSQIDPKDDHLFLGLAEELVHQAQFNAIATRDNENLYDKLIDQALRIRESLIGPDAGGAEMIIEALMNNLQRARTNANAGLSAKAATRLARCRYLMDHLNKVVLEIKRPSYLLLAKVNTLRCFFDQSSGQKDKAKQAFVEALSNYQKMAAHGSLEKTDVYEMFVEQAQLFNLDPQQKSALEKIQGARLTRKHEATVHQIKAFPTIDQIQELMHRARAKKGKTYYLTSMGFIGSQNLMVGITADKITGDLTIKIDQTEISTDDAAYVLRHIKDLWKSMQSKPKAVVLKADMHASHFNTHDSSPALQQQPSGKPDDFDFRQPVGFKDLLGQEDADSYSRKLNYAEAQAGFEGNLKSLPAFGLLQTISLNENTGVLEISTSKGPLCVFFDKGRPVHASSGSASGIDALYEFVLQEEGFFRFNPGVQAPLQTLKLSVAGFMLEAASLYDEMKYLRSLGMTMYSGVFARESFADRESMQKALMQRHVECDEAILELYSAIEERPILMEAIEESGLSLAQWAHALYQLVQSGIVAISNEGFEADIFSQRIANSWTYDKKKVEKLTNTLIDTRTLAYKFEFFVFLLEKEIERARTHMFPLSIAIFEIRKIDKAFSQLSSEDKEQVMSVLAELTDAKRQMDWLCVFEEEQFALIMPGLDTNLATMFVRNFLAILSRALGRLKDATNTWDYSFGIASVPQDTIQWQKMVGMALEAQREARIKRIGLLSHQEMQEAEKSDQK